MNLTVTETFAFFSHKAVTVIDSFAMQLSFLQFDFLSFRTRKKDNSDHTTNNSIIDRQGIYTYPSSNEGYLQPESSMRAPRPENSSQISATRAVVQFGESRYQHRALSKKSSSSSSRVYTDLFHFSAQITLPPGGFKEDPQSVLIH